MDVRWPLCGVLLYDEKQIAPGDEPATCRKCQRFRTATRYLKRREAMKACEEDLTGRRGSPPRMAATERPRRLEP